MMRVTTLQLLVEFQLYLGALDLHCISHNNITGPSLGTSACFTGDTVLHCYFEAMTNGVHVCLTVLRL